MKPLIGILGCGPAGLLAAYACQQRGVPFVILSIPVRSRLGGAQFSHIPIPGIHENKEDHAPDAMLRYIVKGDAETYREKVYGSAPVPFVSFEGSKDGQEVPAWSLPEMYEKLWKKFERNVTRLELGCTWAQKAADFFDIVFSSVPLPTICFGPLDPNINHWFREQPVKILNSTLMKIPDNTVVYDGTEDHTWYRMSNIFGVGSTEWGGSSPTPPIPGLRTINKPIATNCDCHPLVFRIGRFGTWMKGQLTFHAYNRVIDVLAEQGVT